MRVPPLLLFALAGCTGRAPGPAPLQPQPAPPSPTDAPARPVAPPRPNLTLARDQRVPLQLGGTATLRYENLVLEDIAASPDGSYPAGSGITLDLILDGGATPERVPLTLLSSGYRSRPCAWFGEFRVTLIDVKDPHRAPRVELALERVSARTRPGAPQVVRVEVGQSIPLDDEVRVEFLGNSTKHIDPGEKPPLMVALRYHVPGEPPLSTEFNVGSDDKPQTWIWRDYHFTILASGYNASMQVAVARLQLDLATPG